MAVKKNGVLLIQPVRFFLSSVQPRQAHALDFHRTTPTSRNSFLRWHWASKVSLPLYLKR
jgi:hypothetical protein